MEIEPKNQSRNFRSEKFVCSHFLAEWKTAFIINGSANIALHYLAIKIKILDGVILLSK